MPVIIVPEIVRLMPIRIEDPQPWTVQPDGGHELMVEDLMEPSEIASAATTDVQREVIALDIATPRLEAKMLRPYQNECVEAVFKAWANGKKAPLIVIATGGGKTVVAAEIIRQVRTQNPGFQHRVWFLAHRKELLDQTYRLVKLIAPEATCGIVQGGRDDVGKYVTIGSVDTLAINHRFERAVSGANPTLSSIVAKPPSLVIIDEAHHSTSPKYQKVVAAIRAANPACRFLGMTATPGRTDGTALDKVFDTVAYERNTFQLLAEGYLVPPTGYRVELNIDLDVIPTESGEFKKAPLSKVMNQPQINQAVVEGYLKYGDGRKLLAFCVDRAHARDLADVFRQMNVNARHVDGAMKDDDRKTALQAFAEGKTRILTSCDVLTEGYDDPSAQGILFCRPTNSQLVYIQAIGRALRPHPSKQDALIIDCVGNSARHKLAQLASLAGLDEFRGDGKLGPKPDGEEPEIGEAEVGGMDAHRIDFRVLRERQSKWSWRETRFGWTVSIPRIGYFLLSWITNDRRTVDVKFHDMRDGRRDSPPLVLSVAMDFEMAYVLVEAEIERLFTARTARFRGKEVAPTIELARQAIEEGMTGELFSPEELMRKDADWRNKPTSERQKASLIDVGVKPESVPATAGEASDLFSVMTIEKNAKMREPATSKQRGLILQQKLATREELETMTKKQAAGLIVRFLKEKEAKKKAEDPGADDIPPPRDEDNY